MEKSNAMVTLDQVKQLLQERLIDVPSTVRTPRADGGFIPIDKEALVMMQEKP
jgi:hypothetical protein